MEHLSGETLARLVDEAPAQEETEHLERCRRCREELEALRNQTVSLSHLPDLRPPETGWRELEERLLAEGLLSGRAGSERHGSRTGPRRGGSAGERSGWLQLAAGLILLLGGAGLGIGFMGASGGSGDAPFGRALGDPVSSSAVLAALDPGAAGAELSLEEASELVRLTESWYLSALVRYRERMEEEDEAPTTFGDPLTRFAALETLLAAGQAAVRDSPTDPFLNGLLVNMRAEREATLRGMRASTSGGNWY